MSFIKLRKIWEDDDGMVQVELSASNELLTTTQDFYAYPEQLQQFGLQLFDYFPKGGKGNVVFEYGSETETFYSYVNVKAFYINIGATGLQIRTNNKKDGHNGAICDFCIESTLHEVNDLGKRIESWTKNMDSPLACFLHKA
jgi:hypothetical protein